MDKSVIFRILLSNRTFIGYHKKETPRSAYELLLMAGFAAGGYHLFSLVKQLDAHPEPNK